MEDERHCTLRDAFIRLCIELHPLDGPLAVIRTDPAPGFTSLAHDELLHRHRLSIEVGRVKNPNKNPVAEKAVRELEDELLRQNPERGPVSPLALSTATATLNSRLRSSGLSSREMLYQRDQFTHQQIPVSDYTPVRSQHQRRLKNHSYSEHSKARHGCPAPVPDLAVGDLVYLYSDRNKTSGRNRYLVSSVEGAWCNIRKFVGTQLRSTSYRVKRSECYKVPSQLSHSDCHPRTSGSSFTPTSAQAPYTMDQTPKPPDPPDVPPCLSTPVEPPGFQLHPPDRDQEILPSTGNTEEDNNPVGLHVLKKPPHTGH